MAERMFQKHLSEFQSFEISSAGLQAVAGAQMEPHAARQLIAHGGDPAGFRGKQITMNHVMAADLVLTMTRGQRDELIKNFPLAMHRTFTMAEFAFLSELSADTSASTQEAITLASRTRAQVRLTKADDVPDPIDAPLAVHELVGNQIVSLVNRIVQQLTNSK